MYNCTNTRSRCTGSRAAALLHAPIRVAALVLSACLGRRQAAGTGPRRDEGRPQRSRRRSLAALGLAAVLLVVLAGDLALPAQAQTAGTLVSNTGQTTTSASTSLQSQPFTTGGNPGGYTLTSVDVGMGPLVNEDTFVRIVPNATNGEPDLSDSTKFIALTSPATFTEDALNTFTAPAGTVLAANTTYHVYLTDIAEGGPDNIQRTSSNAEDAGGEAGWSIGDTRYWRSNTLTPWNASTTTFTRMKINGYAFAAPPTEVPSDWSLIPTGLTTGDQFRLIFLSSTKRDGSATDIATYNTFIQTRAAAGHTDIQAYSAGFSVVGCTADVDARDNTGTTGVGVPIYWLNGAKVADDYADFYDEDWDEEAADKNELGANGPNTNNSGNYPLTGCDHDGTEAFSPGGSSLALGTDDVAGGRPNSTSSDHGPLSGAILDPTTNRPMYGLSAVFEVAAVVTNSDPTFSSSTAAREVAENTAAGQNVGAVLTASDSDMDTLTYTLEGTDSASFALDTTTTAGSAQIQTKTGVTYDHEVKSSYTVVVKADDGGGGTAASVTVSIAITDVDEAPERPAAPTVTATSGSTTSLSVSWTEPVTTGPDIDDYDLRYRAGTSGNWSNGPQDVTATLASIGSLDAGTSYQVQVRATNDEGDSNWSPSGSGATTAEATPTVSISADKTSAVFKQDGITYTLTRSGSTTGALTVSVTLTQTKDFLLATALTKMVTIAAGQSTKTFTVAASSFQHFAAGTTVEGGTLTAAVQDVLGYDLGSPSSVDVSIVIHSMIGFDQASYTIGEAGGTLTVKLIARTGPGAPQPASNTSTVELIPVNQTTSSGDFNASFIAYQFTPSEFSLTGGVWKVEESLAITITNDDLDEDDETFDLEIEYRIGTQHTPLVDASGNSCGSKCTVTVTITDNDTAGVTVSKSALTVTEQDTSGDTYTVVLDSQPTADVTISVGGQSGTDVTAAPTPMTFTTLNWNTAQTVTVTGDDDADLTNDMVSLTHNAASSDGDYQGIGIAGLTVTVNDNDTAQVLGLMVEPGNAQLVVEWTAVANATGYQVQWKSGGESYNNGGRRAIISSGSTTSHTIPSLTNGTEYTVRVRATRTGANAGAYSAEALETPVMPTAAGVTISESALTVTEQESTGDTYTVVLDRLPTASVTVTVGGLGSSDVSANPSSLTFTTLNWATAQTVTVTAGNDADTTNDTVSLTHSAMSSDSAYQGITIAGLTVTVNDNDTARVTGVMIEPGNAQLVVGWTAVSNATGYEVQWKSGVQSYNNSRQATIGSGSTTSHTISSLTNGTEYTVRVRATRTGANSGAYSAEALETPVMPTAAGVTVSKSALTVTEEDFSGDTYTVVLDRLPTASVTISIGGWVGTDVLATPSPMTFTTGNWATAQTVTVTAGDDADTTNDTVSLSHSAVSSDTAYEGITIAGVTVTVNDNDTAQVTGLMVEPGNAQLAVEWTAVANATGYEVQWKSGGQSYNTSRQATISSGSTTSHTISSLNNGTEYSVRVRATRTGANAGAYSAEVLETPVMPTAAGVTVSESALTVTEQDTTGDSYTVVLDRLPTASVTVTVGGFSSSDVTANPASLTFTTVNWATPQTVTVTAGNDADTTNDTVSLSHSAMSSDSDYQGITIAGLTVTVTDNDTGNTPAEGKPTISGPAQVGRTLTASTAEITDAEGLTTVSYSYQWLASGTVIGGATSSTYSVSASVQGDTIAVRVTFDDDEDNPETLTSNATSNAVAPAAVTCPTDTLWCSTLTAGYGTANMDGEFFLGLGAGIGTPPESYGSLDDATFTHLGAAYTVTQFFVDADGLASIFATSPNLPDDGAGLTLQVQQVSGQREIPLSGKTYSSIPYLPATIKAWQLRTALRSSVTDPLTAPLLRGFDRAYDPYGISDRRGHRGHRLADLRQPPGRGRPDDFRQGAGGRDADGRHWRHRRRRRAADHVPGQLRLAVAAGGRRRRVERDAHRRRRRDLHAGGGGCGQEAQGAGEFQRRRGRQRDADQRRLPVERHDHRRLHGGRHGLEVGADGDGGGLLRRHLHGRPQYPADRECDGDGGRPGQLGSDRHPGQPDVYDRELGYGPDGDGDGRLRYGPDGRHGRAEPQRGEQRQQLPGHHDRRPDGDGGRQRRPAAAAAAGGTGPRLEPLRDARLHRH